MPNLRRPLRNRIKNVFSDLDPDMDARDFREGLAEVLDVEEEDIDLNMLKGWYSDFLNAVRNGEGFKMRALGVRLGYIIQGMKRRNRPKALENYAKSQAELTDTNVEDVKLSDAYKNYKKSITF